MQHYTLIATLIASTLASGSFFGFGGGGGYGVRFFQPQAQFAPSFYPQNTPTVIIVNQPTSTPTVNPIAQVSSAGFGVLGGNIIPIFLNQPSASPTAQATDTAATSQPAETGGATDAPAPSPATAAPASPSLIVQQNVALPDNQNRFMGPGGFF